MKVLRTKFVRVSIPRGKAGPARCAPIECECVPAANGFSVAGSGSAAEPDPECDHSWGDAGTSGDECEFDPNVVPLDFVLYVLTTPAVACAAEFIALAIDPLTYDDVWGNPSLSVECQGHFVNVVLPWWSAVGAWWTLSRCGLTDPNDPPPAQQSSRKIRLLLPRGSRILSSHCTDSIPNEVCPPCN